MKRVLRENVYVTCMAKVGHSDSDNFSVAVNPDTDRAGECYLKYYNHKRYRSADKVVRVSLTEPKYVFHKTSTERQPGTYPPRTRKSSLTSLIRSLPSV